MQKIFLHLGYHKTATTFLQQYIFPGMQKVNYIKQKDIKPDLRVLRLRRKISDEHIAKIRRHFLSFDNGQPLLISYEGLSGSPFAAKKTKKQRGILRDLRRVFPPEKFDVRIIIGIREQADLFSSLYVQYIHQGGVLTAENYLKYCENNGSIQNFEFNRYLSLIEKTFGNDSLYIMMYEHFKQDANKEMLKLLNFMGEDKIPAYNQSTGVRKSNKSYGLLQVKIARRLNRYFKSALHKEGTIPAVRIPKLGKLSPRLFLQNKLSFSLHYKKYELPDSLQQTIQERFAEENRKLAEKYQLDLPDSYLNK
ncbi:sulfotransferase domain-containing protein [Virgibacillus ihumii]|uniref:sulfotransferase domain-containing protein n=1 Tax=Virgibacillus ihumii TaxID=2686091 RepID=UPI00157BBEE2|nr:sulfotransferase domain-containing protein [Virgibacillus ihumii]